MASRRGRGEGSLFKRADGLWVATLNTGYGADGKRRRRTVYGKAKAEARDKLLALQVNALRGVNVDPTRQTVSQFLAHWLDVAVRPKLRPTTHLRYAEIVRLHIGPHIGGMRLQKVDPGTVQGLYTRLEDLGASARTRELAHAVLHRAFRQAVK